MGEARVRRAIVTPEGVPINVRLAGRGDRAGAFVIDMMIIAAIVVAVILVASLVFADVLGGYWAVSFVMLALFVLQVFYFLFFELRWQGQTPGKRLLKLRVIDREGGALRADAVVARNLMRQVEVFLPLLLLFSAGPEGPEGWLAAATLVWVGVLVLLPLFNRDRLRAGDLVAGTWVIEVPRHALLADLAEVVAPAAAPAAPGGDQPVPAAAPAVTYTFTGAELDAYGIYELQVLEDVLRGGPRPASARDLERIAARIRRKTRWTPPPGQTVDARLFLEDYYRALRAHLETKMLFGDRRESKHYADKTGNR